SDAELLLQYVQEGSQAAFRTLVDRYTARVFSICRRKLGDRQLAEDAAQMVFMTLAKNAADLNPGPLEGYLAKTAIFISVIMIRKRAVRTKHEQRLQRESRSAHQEQPLEDRIAAVHGAMTRLRKPYRETVALR